MGSSRNNILAGGFVLGGLVLGVWVSFLLADIGSAGGAGSKEFSIRFKLNQSTMGLRDGSAVLLGGQEIGKVKRVRFETVAGLAPGNAEQQVPQAVLVDVSIRADLPIYENAVVALEKPLLGSLSSINISSIGSAEELARGDTKFQGVGPHVEEREIINGSIAPPSFLADAGFGPEQVDQLRSAFANLEKTIADVQTLVEKSGPGVQTSIDDARLLIADLRARSAEWSKRIDTIAANVEAASAKLDPILSKVDVGVDEARAVVASTRAAVDDNRERIDRILANIDEASASAKSAAARVDMELVDLANGALKEARSALATASEAMNRISTIVAEQTPSLRRTIANMRIMSDQLKLTSVEVRSQPWRLLHAPSTKELEVQVLYDATRSYAEASSDVRAAAESLDEATARNAIGGDATSEIDAATTALAEAMGRYRAAEKYFFDKLAEKDRE
jgi:ABC-type transporter Mla subunit MlaD